MQQQKDNPYHRRYFHRYNQWAEFIDALHRADGERNPNANNSSQTDETYKTIPWTGTHTFAEALSYLDTGWKFGLNRIRELQPNVPADLFDCIMPVQDYRPELRHKIAGGSLDVGQFVTGATPENFLVEEIPAEAQQTQQGKKLITIYVQSYISAYCNWDAFFYRGLYAFTMIEHLENCGYSVELWNVFYSYIETDKCYQRVYVKVKEFGEFFDTNKLAIALCAPFYLRRYIFALQETYDDVECGVTNNHYGSMPTKNGIENIVLDDDVDLNPIWIPTINIGTNDKTLAEYRKILDDYTNGGVITA